MSEFHCECGSDACSTELGNVGGGRLGRVRTCAKCGQRSVLDQDPIQPGAPTAEPAGDDVLPAQPVFRLTPPDRKKQRSSARLCSTPAVDSGKPLNVIKLARSRLRDVKRELKILRKLEQERDALERLIRAADGKPVAVVAPIRTAKGA